MKARPTRSILAVAALATLASVAIAMPALAQGNGERTVEQYLCRDFVRESGANRDVAIAFLHGYILGKSGQSTFTPDVLHKQSSAFLDLCIDNPKEPAINVMMKVKN